MKRIIQALSVVVLILLGVAACTIKHEEKSEKCTYNGQDIPCNQMPHSDGQQNPPVSEQKKDCLYAASASLDTDRSIRVCRSANQYSVECLQEASAGMDKDDIVSVCERPTASSSSCIRNSKGQMTSYEVALHCR